MKIMKIIGIIVISIFCFGGVFLGSLLAHEYTHVIQSKEPISMCYDYQQSTFMHVKHNVSKWSGNTEAEVESFSEFVPYTEKTAAIAERGFGYLFAGIIGAAIAFLFKK